MEGPFAILGVGLSGFTALLPMVEKYQKGRAVIDQLAKALGDDARAYKAAFDELDQIRNDLLMPSIEALKDEVSRDKINLVVDSVSEMYVTYGRIIRQFIKLSEDCKGVTLNSAFMDDLKKSNAFLHDYVSQMGRMSTGKGEVKIDKDYFTFVRMHEDKAFPKLKNEDSKLILDKAREYVKLVNHQIKPFLSKSTISRETARRFIDAFLGLNKDIKKMKVPKEVVTNLKDYLPPKLSPLGIFLEEVFPKKDEDKLRFKGHRK